MSKMGKKSDKMKELERTLEMLREELLSIRPKTTPFEDPLRSPKKTGTVYTRRSPRRWKSHSVFLGLG